MAMNNLSDELLQSVLSFVPPEDILRRCSRISHRFARVIFPKHFWQLQYNENDLGSSDFLSKQQIQRFLIYQHHRNENDDASAPGYLKEGSLFVDKATAYRLKRLGNRRACVASTTDHTTEELENVLPSHDMQQERAYAPGFATMPQYWSSRPSHSQESTETLMFSLRHPLNVLKKVTLKPFKEPDPFRTPRRVYTWRQTVLRAYRLSLEELVGVWPSHLPSMFRRVTPTAAQAIRGANVRPTRAEPDQDTIDSLVSSQTPVYESSAHTIPSSSDHVISYTIPSGVIANLVIVELIGKNFEQDRGSGYYICVERADCIGIPLVVEPAELPV